MQNKPTIQQFRHRRNVCAIAALIVYAVTNVAGLALLRSPGWFAFHYGLYFQIGWTVLGAVILALFVAFCAFGARARGWSGWAGLPIALLGVAIWMGVAGYILYQNVNQPTSVYNPARVDNDGPRVLIFLAFAVAALILRVLPKREPKRGTAAPTEAAA